MLQLVEKILLEACESHNELSAINAFIKLRKKYGIENDLMLDESTPIFDKMCCYGIHIYQFLLYFYYFFNHTTPRYLLVFSFHS